jgi:hypothetical protein
MRVQSFGLKLANAKLLSIASCAYVHLFMEEHPDLLTSKRRPVLHKIKLDCCPQAELHGPHRFGGISALQ